MGDDDGKAGGETSRTGVLAVQGEVSRVLNERNGIRGSVREKEGGVRWKTRLLIPGSGYTPMLMVYQSDVDVGKRSGILCLGAKDSVLA